MNTQDVVVSDKITVRSARSTVQRPPRKRRRLAKNLFIQDEAEVDDLAEESEQDQSGEDVEDENGLDFEDGTDDETFQTDLSGFREHQSSRVPSLFADVIQRIENSPLERVDTIKVSDFWQDNQIFLQNALYQHPRAPDVSQRHTVYHVRCRRGYEKRIIRRIQNDIKTFDSRPKQETENRIIEDVHPSKMPGYVYLVIMNTSDITPLCDYLHSFSSFVYNRPTINRQDSFMPIHHVVTDFHPLAPVAPGCSIGDWVEIKGGDAYAGSLGLVVPNDSRLEYPSENSVTVLTVPRIPRSPLEEESMIATLLGPAAAPLSFESALQISNLYASLNVLHWGKSGTPLWGNSIKSRCHVGSMCPPDHSKELFFRGEIFQCGLIVLVFNHSNLKPAPTSWDSKIVEIFASSHHPHLSYTKMPIPSSWYFEVDEKVHGITGFIPSQYLSIRASIVDVSDLTCEVDFAGEVLTVSKHGLIKSFTGGECVLIPDGGAGTFAMSGEDSSSCIVFYDERTVRDKITRIKLERVDSDFRRSSVERARRIIFEKGYSVSSKAVENLLGDYSWTSTRNTFSTLFYEFGFNFYNIIVSDVLHEIELGVWKAVLTHLIRILTSVGSLSLEEMNQRFRRIPTFGRDTIRKINKNVSLMQNLAARDYEDFLQVSLPVFEGLFGTHNKNVQHLLFDLNAVHSFAKLRLHSDPTLDVLDRHTSQLGKSLRVFKNHVCPAFSTKELAKEAGARQRRQAKDQQKRGSTLRSKKAAQTPNKKVFSLSTYKIHALGSYARFIRMFGTTDSYSTQVGELEHRRIKRFYSRTNKVFRYVRQVTGHERRVRIIQSIKQRLEDRNSTAPRVPFQHKDPLLVTDPRTHYHISMDRSLFYNISRWTEEHEHDLSVKHFLRKLKIHLFCRLTTQNDSGDISLEDRSQVIIDSNRMYLHKVLRINYTSYDLRRCQDSINARTHSDIMVLSPDSDDDEHPYLYARVIGIYHVNASLQDEPLKQMDFLWVRWYAMEDNQSCWKTKRLPEVGFIDSTDDQAFGFIDPAHVIRAVHLLPNFDVGQVSDILGPSIARRSDEEDQDYSRYYVNIFADRDMVIRFCPDLTLGAHIATSIPMEYASSDVESEEEVDEEELGEEEDDEDEIEIASRAGSADSDQDSVESDKYVDGEWSDFGYDNGDSSNDEEQENERDAIDGSNIGPEDGEEPFNHDVEVLDTEGYAVL
ncbi:hypothetical protein D9757_004995 [Collybiopsis confluens]|uniref:Uncharacterized protein n=1 Tax=Collybiopsis confluens TaxID=2823264 RepID=A0A8H5HT88_9AGAR|nr:hypothetical protein D9757_004995 [Collybiopsis confluens]